MKIHYFQHVEFEGLAHMQQWAESAGHSISCTKLYCNEKFPDHSSYDLLIVMGGPMGVYEEAVYPWMKLEKEFIKEAISLKKRVLGICLGAQLLADVLGGKVYKNEHKEIGWWPVLLTSCGKKHSFFKDFPEEFMAFQWHGDTFTLPPGSIHLAESKGCLYQAFSYEDRVVGLQFHMEATEESIQDLCRECSRELTPDIYIQDEETIKNKTQSFLKNTHRLLKVFLKKWSSCSFII